MRKVILFSWLTTIFNLIGLIYVFNENKTSPEVAKTMFQNIFNHPDATIKEKIYTAIFQKISPIYSFNLDLIIAKGQF